MKIDGHTFVTAGAAHAVEGHRHEILLSDGTPDNEVVLAQKRDGECRLLRHTLDNEGALRITVPPSEAGTTQTWQVFTTDTSGTLILEGSFTLTAPATDPVPDPSLFVITWMKFWGMVEVVWNWVVRTYRAWKGTIGTAIAVLIVIGLVGGCAWGIWEGIKWAISDDGSSESAPGEVPQEKGPGPTTPQEESKAEPLPAEAAVAPAAKEPIWWQPPQEMSGQRVGLAMVERRTDDDTNEWHVYTFKEGEALACRKLVTSTLTPTSVYLIPCPPEVRAAFRAQP